MIGKTISHYKIIEELGRGGMGVVYKAEDIKLNRRVALKFLPLEYTGDKVAKERFLREAQTASALDHPNICTIHEIAESEDGQLFIVMGFYEGMTLKEKIKDKRLKINEIIDVTLQIAHGLDRAHDAGIVHRDLKPANIIITAHHEVKILDFGLAKLSGQAQLTKELSTLGTAAYMSPEQAQGKEVDHRTDIWSLGVILYEMLAGELPFKGAYEQAFIYAVINEAPAPLAETESEIPDDVQSIVSKLLAKQPEDRYQNLNNLIDDLKKRGTSISTIPSIAVLPFVNMSDDPEQEYFCDGITEEIINALTHIPDLRVIARTSAFAFKNKQADVRDIGKQLGVETLLEGSVRKSGQQIRITAQLISVSDGSHLWSEKYDRLIDDIFKIQDDVSLKIAEKLKIRQKPTERYLVENKYSKDINIYNLYLKGRFCWSTYTKEGFLKGIEYYEQAIQKDPAYAPAYAGIATCNTFLGYYHYFNPEEQYQKAEKAAQKALELNPDLSEAYLARAWVKMGRDWDWNGTIQLFKKSLTLNPGYATAHSFYGACLSIVGRHKEAIAEAAEAEKLDPLSPINGAILGLRYYYDRDYARSIEKLKQMSELNPHFAAAYWMMALPLAAAGEINAAINASEKALQMFKDEDLVALYVYGVALGLSPDRRQEAFGVIDKILNMKEKKQISSFFIGFIYAVLEKLEEAFHWTYKAYHEHDPLLIWVKSDPIIHDRLKGDPRYADILEKMGLKNDR